MVVGRFIDKMKYKRRIQDPVEIGPFTRFSCDSHAAICISLTPARIITASYRAEFLTLRVARPEQDQSEDPFHLPSHGCLTVPGYQTLSHSLFKKVEEEL